ncbi:hypothetical protein LSG16_03475 [Lactococcus cremoris]|uniref:hypothetical protein n=1 Tax=Lactococcus lactis subsp. cremoris TaxID=1359 RepID=UPI001E55188D|nr:hypothetical protein [Lactococcus cremoris]MCD6631897.1 hypothetical protein [Lactococcus cremoris]
MGEISSFTGVFTSMKNYIEKVIKIPFSCIVFLISIFLMFNPKLLSLIGINKWFPNQIKEIVLKIGQLFYSNMFFVSIGFVLFVLVLFGITYLPTEKIFPKDVELVNGKIKSWNSFSAFSTGINLFVLYLTTWWTYYFFINVLFNKNGFNHNFFISDKSNALYLNMTNPIIHSGYISSLNLLFMNIIFYLNIFITAYFIVQRLYQDIYILPKNSIKYNSIDTYFEYNSKVLTNSSDEETKIAILRYKHWDEAKYLLVKIPLTKNTFEWERWQQKEVWKLRKIPPAKKSIYIVLEDKELTNVIYAFDNFK